MTYLPQLKQGRAHIESELYSAGSINSGVDLDPFLAKLISYFFLT